MGNAVSESHVTEEVVNVGEEVVIGEVVIGFLKIKLAVAEGLTKNHISRLPYRIVRGRILEVHNARRDGVDRSGGASSRAEWQTLGLWYVC
jgi:hypothetical protein